jgi:rubrerythrin
MLKPELVIKLKEQFKAEAQAYNTYKVINRMIEDEFLNEALEEIMYDEFLHAKFLRSFLMEHNAYDPAECVELEKSYKEMLND